LVEVFVPAERGARGRREDPYGAPLTYVLAGELAAVRLPKDTAYWTRAAWAYLRALPKDTVVVLGWN
jgi:hypothetical protein